MKTSLFGKTKDGKDVTLYRLENKNGMEIALLDFGAILHQVLLPNEDGTKTDIVLACDNMEEYYENGNAFGSTVGPNANRTANAEATIDGVQYHLVKNDGENNLHTQTVDGMNLRLWNAQAKDNSVTFSIKLDDMEMGLPGNRDFSVTYTLTDDNEIVIDYFVTSDKNTMINMTNHSYFNLKGHKAGNVLSHEVWLNSDSYTEVGPGAIPTGRILSTNYTPLDFSTMKPIERDFDMDNEQMAYVGGYNFNHVVRDYNEGVVRPVAEVYEATTNRRMKVFSDLPGVHFYTADWVSDAPGKEGMVYQAHYGLCMETQYYPDYIHHSNFQQAIFGPGKDYRTTTIFAFN